MSSRLRLSFLMLCLLVIGLITTSAHADNYTYTFSGTADLSSGGTETVGFIFNTANPISSFTSLMESQLSSCSNCASTPLPVVSFLPGSILGDGLVFNDLNGIGSFLFTSGAFSTVGNYTSGGIFNAGTLSVTNGSTVAVPDPSTGLLALLAGGCLAIMALAKRDSLGQTAGL